jgi:integrase
MQSKVWIIPPDRMKSGREHRAPLSSAALSLLAGMDRKGERIFDTSQTTLLEITRALHAGIVPHGFRSSFRDWCAERTNFPSEVAEMALAHVVGSKVEAAYRRGDMFDKRRRLMDAWAKFCATEPVERDKVVPMQRRG